MARRRTRKPARRQPKKTNLLNVAQSVIIGNAVTQGLFNTNMFEFATGRIGGAYTPGAISESNKITLPELLGAGMGSYTTKIGGQSTQYGGASYTTTTVGYGGVVAPATLGSVVQDNLKNNGVAMATTLVVTPIAFKVIGKLASKPRREFNKLARMVGLPVSM
jgi:hypothetical protein